jgi:hypothetical protein
MSLPNNDRCLKHLETPGQTWGRCNVCVRESSKTSSEKLTKNREEFVRVKTAPVPSGSAGDAGVSK